MERESESEDEYGDVEMKLSKGVPGYTSVEEDEEKLSWWNWFVLLHWLGLLMFIVAFATCLGLSFGYPHKTHANMTFTRATYDFTDPNEYYIEEKVVGSLSFKFFLIIPGLGMIYFAFLALPFGYLHKSFKVNIDEVRSIGGADMIDNQNSALLNVFLHNTCRHGSGLKFLVMAVLWSGTVFMVGVYFRISDIMINTLNALMVMVGMTFIWYYEQAVQHRSAGGCQSVHSTDHIKERAMKKQYGQNFAEELFHSQQVHLIRKVGATILVLVAESLPHIVLIVYFSMLSERGLAEIFVFSLVMFFYVICILMYSFGIAAGWYHDETPANYMIVELVILLTQVLIIPGICLTVFIGTRHSTEWWTV